MADKYRTTTYYRAYCLSEDGLLKRPKRHDWGGYRFQDTSSKVKMDTQILNKGGVYAEYVVLPIVEKRIDFPEL